MKEEVAQSLFLEVDKLLAEQDPLKALSIIEQIIQELSEKDLWFRGRALFWRQLCYKQLMDLKEAEKAGKEALQIYRKLGDRVQSSNVLRDTASLYEHLGKYEKALKTINEALLEIEDQKVLQTLGLNLAKKGRILSEINDDENAEKALLSAELVIDSTDNLMHRLTVSTHLMELYVRLQDYDKATYYVKKSDSLLKKLKNETGYLNQVRYSQIELARSLIAQAKGKYKESIMRLRNFLKFGIRPKVK